MIPALSTGSLFYPGPITIEAIQEEAVSQFANKLVTIDDFKNFEAFREWWLEALMDDDVDIFQQMFVEAFEILRREILSYKAILASYKTTLKRNRGQAIDLGGGTYAVIDGKGQLFAFNADMTGDFSSGSQSNFNAIDFNECSGSWEGMTRQATYASVENPVLVPLTEE